MTWNYRIVKFVAEYGLCEVYYNEDGRPVAYSPECKLVCDFEEGHEAIIEELKFMLEAVENAEVLDAAVFDLPLEERPITPRSKKDD